MPNKLYLVNEDGSPTEDMSDHVAHMYDALVGSMDWGSNFLCQEEINALVQIGRSMGYNLPPDWKAKLNPEEYKQAIGAVYARHHEERNSWNKGNMPQPSYDDSTPTAIAWRDRYFAEIKRQSAELEAFNTQYNSEV